MKKILFTLAGLCLAVIECIAQPNNHPVIEKVQVIYKPYKSVVNSGQTSSTLNVPVKGTTLITLKAGYNASKIYLKICDEKTQALIYQVNYPIRSADILENGAVVYHKQDSIISIANPLIVSLRPYVYELYTEDETGAESSVYKISQ